MSSASVKDLVQIVAALPRELQEQVLEYLREYVADLQDEQQWEASFHQTQSALVAAARRAKQDRAMGKSKPMDFERFFC
ncbi:hypothetical protein NG796_22990 [Laspinema sp. A4]|uniref:hypothetical protein n=1 Tax=Laspinema sp. D2d TaxID=2953686 RepID=UPI0021BB731B|nr:hypothetical protein [Laspinema sp. D2d]MCT7986143.1 hypothetical protein [Laspinema sp. D2d]